MWKVEPVEAIVGHLRPVEPLQHLKELRRFKRVLNFRVNLLV
ncbi:MAG: hypothetical protein V7L01_01220 [Nostoc sp.]